MRHDCLVKRITGGLREKRFEVETEHLYKLHGGNMKPDIVATISDETRGRISVICDVQVVSGSDPVTWHSNKIDKYNDRADLKTAIRTRHLSTEVQTVDTITHQLDEILISNNRLGRASYKVLGKFEEQRDELRSLHSHINDLHCDLGAQREKITQCLNEKENVMAELAALHTIGISVPESSAMPPRLIPPPVEYVDVDEDCIMVVSPSGASYAATAAVKNIARKNRKKREEFPQLETPKTRIPFGSAAPIKSRLGTRKTSNSGKQKAVVARQMNIARTARVCPRFEVNTDSDGWIEPRKSVEQKLPNPKVRTVRTKNGGLVLFPEDADTAAALRRTGNLVERAPRLPRVIIKYVDRLLDKEEIPWALGKNPALGISDLEQERIRPLFMLGPRAGHTVHWVIEVTPDTLKKIEGKSAYLGMTKCKMKLYDTVTQCYNCQGFGHTAQKCREDKPRCKQCSERHDSRSCTAQTTKVPQLSQCEA
ncbi:unnamed protein product [Macrosiphum euphorbiae]|uniref:CCHC-type domain-containing protein n=1 Tax=Macrosiphum euphorbiae TaxID=13131 RepID=A0AAV0WJH1_9HEMI|nr:unnamed protein product [Macrosiphum euphorbiae]